MIKAVFFDLDGTLLSPQTGFCSPATKAALLALKKKGIKLCVATGRSPYEFTLTPIIEGLPFDAIVALNGLCCYDSEGIIYQRLFDKEDLSLLIDKVTAVNCPCTIIKRDDMYINLINDHVRQAHAAIHAPTPRTGELSNALTEDVIMAMVYHPVGGDADNILSVLRKSHATRWHPYSVDVVPNGCSKKTGIDEVLKKYGIRWDEVMAFGDGENDHKMLQNAKIGVAMGNSDPILLNGDFYVTDDADHDGIVSALKHFGLIDSEEACL